MFLVSSGKAFQEHPLLPLHSEGLVRSPFVVIPNEVEEPVDQEAFDLADERMSRFRGLAGGGR
jgi:hypothetical protein